MPVFGTAAQAVFLFGAFAVLYSTFFVATASHARVCADALRVFGVSTGDETTYRRCDARLIPGKIWDVGLWISVAGLFVAGGFALYTKVVTELIGGK